MNTEAVQLGVGLSGKRKAVLLVLLTSMAGAVVAVQGAMASIAVSESTIVPAERLLMHGIELKALPAGTEGAVISAETARETARKLIDAPRDPDETYRVLASATYDAPKQTAWLLLFAGGSELMGGGPPEGAETRRIKVDFIGVLIDDQTGEVLRWFRGGSTT